MSLVITKTDLSSLLMSHLLACQASHHWFWKVWFPSSFSPNSCIQQHEKGDLVVGRVCRLVRQGSPFVCTVIGVRRRERGAGSHCLELRQCRASHVGRRLLLSELVNVNIGYRGIISIYQRLKVNYEELSVICHNFYRLFILDQPIPAVYLPASLPLSPFSNWR